MSPTRELAFARAYGRCEAMVKVGNVWTRCGRKATDVHHMLPRSRGGTSLDEVGETYHLVVLDRQHHNYVHGHPADAYLAGLTIDGQAWTDLGVVVYRGTDPYLTERYGSEVRQPGQDR